MAASASAPHMSAPPRPPTARSFRATSGSGRRRQRSHWRSIHQAQAFCCNLLGRAAPATIRRGHPRGRHFILSSYLKKGFLPTIHFASRNHGVLFFDLLFYCPRAMNVLTGETAHKERYVVLTR